MMKRAARIGFVAFVLLGASVKAVDLPAGYTPPVLPRIPDKHFKIEIAGDEKPAVITKSVQSAIDTAGGAGGGVVEIPTGDFLCGPLQLASGVELHLDSGAMLKLLPIDKYPGGTVDPKNFISGAGLHDIAITGEGTIDGQGSAWWPFAKDAGTKRPRMIGLSGCDRVLIEKVTLMNSPMFHIAISGKSSNVTVKGVTIRANPSTDPVHPGHNTDACDVTGTHVLVEDCDISVGDDDYTCSGGTSDVLLINNKYGYGHGVSIGSKTSGEISNITVDSCTFKDTECGIRIKSDRDRGGNVHDLTYRNLKMINVGCPILIYASYMATEKQYRNLNDLTAEIAGSYPAKPLGPHTPNYHNFTFSNITATASPGHRAGLIWGLPEANVTNVLLQNVNITADKPFGIYDAKEVRVVDCKITTPQGVNKLSIANSQVDLGDK